MYFNKIYLSSTEQIITRSSPANTFNIELQHRQPRRRQVFDRNNENDNKDKHHAHAYSIQTKQEEFYSSDPDQLTSNNNLMTIPTNLPTIYIIFGFVHSFFVTNGSRGEVRHFLTMIEINHRL
jgi:hypothetical protein